MRAVFFAELEVDDCLRRIPKQRETRIEYSNKNFDESSPYADEVLHLIHEHMPNVSNSLWCLRTFQQLCSGCNSAVIVGRLPGSLALLVCKQAGGKGIEGGGSHKTCCPSADLC